LFFEPIIDKDYLAKMLANLLINKTVSTF